MALAAIRGAALGDLDALAAIEAACFTADIACKKRQLRRFVVNGRTLVAVDNAGRIFGQITMVARRHHGKQSLQIYNLAILAQWRGQGYAQELVAAALRQFADEQTTRLSLEVEQGNAAIRLYCRLGFAQEKILPHYYGKDRHGVRMARPISQAPPGHATGEAARQFSPWTAEAGGFAATQREQGS